MFGVQSRSQPKRPSNSAFSSLAFRCLPCQSFLALFLITILISLPFSYMVPLSFSFPLSPSLLFGFPSIRLFLSSLSPISSCLPFNISTCLLIPGCWFPLVLLPLWCLGISFLSWIGFLKCFFFPSGSLFPWIPYPFLCVLLFLYKCLLPISSHLSLLFPFPSTPVMSILLNYLQFPSDSLDCFVFSWSSSTILVCLSFFFTFYIYHGCTFSFLFSSYTVFLSAVPYLRASLELVLSPSSPTWPIVWQPPLLFPHFLISIFLYFLPSCSVFLISSGTFVSHLLVLHAFHTGKLLLPSSSLSTFFFWLIHSYLVLQSPALGLPVSSHIYCFQSTHNTYLQFALYPVFLGSVTPWMPSFLRLCVQEAYSSSFLYSSSERVPSMYLVRQYPVNLGLKPLLFGHPFGLPHSSLFSPSVPTTLSLGLLISLPFACLPSCPVLFSSCPIYFVFIFYSCLPCILPLHSLSILLLTLLSFTHSFHIASWFYTFSSSSFLVHPLYSLYYRVLSCCFLSPVQPRSSKPSLFL